MGLSCRAAKIAAAKSDRPSFPIKPISGGRLLSGTAGPPGLGKTWIEWLPPVARFASLRPRHALVN